MNQAVQVYDDAAARTTALPSPNEGQVTYRKDTKLLEAFTGSAFTAVSSILQVVQTVKTDVFSTTNTAFVDVTGLAVSITPRATTSKILVFVDLQISDAGNIGNDAVGARLLRGGTVIYQGDADGAKARGIALNKTSAGSATQRQASPIPAIFLDSPNTTSATTYKVQVYSAGGGSRTAFVNRAGQEDNNTTSMRVASSITVMEVAG
jgi:hypothetical protein